MWTGLKPYYWGMWQILITTSKCLKKKKKGKLTTGFIGFLEKKKKGALMTKTLFCLSKSS